ncbi:hypothetical protein X762_12470 [Mesorhizobium sp. LSHC426A00]|nr:hypothetical protein X762_12470 [Mesorhizobium sp. LSHC426A00]ESX56235.1 hypothetical protein X761_12500 [Mesorhizobium sp. LSHC424B00]ESX73082.1 hypothetical protein X758_11830 [Mesorhizobium sp. LSHC416B00]ESZ42913.1 hypothetical protein X732_02110 [Mesorhizobium sp. L2C066B000]
MEGFRELLIPAFDRLLRTVGAISLVLSAGFAVRFWWPL